ncbi:hypothetical protein ACL02U_12750 [Streptomyces sp. MS06]|uniref:hypothetical protein n=1 Tax=Streptomyces sp. MS06 TaxID=3385974 RepID=UPI00399F7154
MADSGARRWAALGLTAAALLAAAGCSGGDSGASRAGASTPPSVYATDPGKGGPCRATMNDITAVGKKLSADAKDRDKAAADLQDAADRFQADAEKIENPKAKKAAQQLGTVYDGLADGARNNRSPDLKTLPGKVQSAVTALGDCAAGE